MVYGRINLTKMPRIGSMMAATEGKRPSQVIDSNSIYITPILISLRK